MLRALKTKLAAVNHEELKVLAWIRELSSKHSSGGFRVLDYGCGKGRFLIPLHHSGVKVTGVDLNAELVGLHQSNGLDCWTPESLDGKRTFDLILLSHIIEHFEPNALLKFMESIQQKLERDGRVLIATPLLSKTFFHDWDHIRPYHPESFEMMFGSEEIRQIQYHSRITLELDKIWFRKTPWRIRHCASLYQRPRSLAGNGVALMNLGLIALFKLSLGALGSTDGWLGLYRKSDSAKKAN